MERWLQIESAFYLEIIRVHENVTILSSMQLCFSLWHLYISFYSTFAHKNVNQSLNSN